MAQAASVKCQGFAASDRDEGSFPDNCLPPGRPLRAVSLQSMDRGRRRGGGAGTGLLSSDALALSILRAHASVPFERGRGGRVGALGKMGRLL